MVTGGREALPRPLSPAIQGRQHLSFSGLSFTQRPPDPLQLHPFRESMFEDLLKVSAYMGQRLVSLNLICCVRRWSQGARRGLSLAGTTSKPQGQEGKSCPVSRQWTNQGRTSVPGFLTQGFPPPSLLGKDPKRQLSLALNALNLPCLRHPLTDDWRQPLPKVELQVWSRARQASRLGADSNFRVATQSGEPHPSAHPPMHPSGRA